MSNSLVQYRGDTCEASFTETSFSWFNLGNPSRSMALTNRFIICITLLNINVQEVKHDFQICLGQR